MIIHRVINLSRPHTALPKSPAPAPSVRSLRKATPSAASSWTPSVPPESRGSPAGIVESSPPNITAASRTGLWGSFEGTLLIQVKMGKPRSNSRLPLRHKRGSCNCGSSPGSTSALLFPSRCPAFHPCTYPILLSGFGERLFSEHFSPSSFVCCELFLRRFSHKFLTTLFEFSACRVRQRGLTRKCPRSEKSLRASCPPQCGESIRTEFWRAGAVCGTASYPARLSFIISCKYYLYISS